MGGNNKDRRGSRQADFEDAQAGPTTRTSYVQADDLIPTFSGSDKTFSVARWTQEVDDHAEIFQWTPLQTLIVARRSLTGTAALWLRSERAFKSWDELKAGISKEFPDAIDSKTIHEMMSQRKKRKDESCMDYLLSMKEMGKRGKMPDYVAIRYIIDGIVDAEVNKMVLYGANTYPDLKEKIKIYETIKEKMTRREPRPEPTLKKRGSRCFNCGELDHQSSQCPHKDKGLKCFKCNQFGHIATRCNDSASTSAREISQDRVRRRRVDFLKTDGNDNDRTIPTPAYVTNFTSDYDMSNQDGDRCNTSMTIKMAEPIPRSDSDRCSMMADREKFKFVYNNEQRLPVQETAYKTINVNNFETKALIDSGSSVNIISSDFYNQIGCPDYQNTITSFTGLGCSKVTSTKTTYISINLDGHDYQVMFYVILRDAMPCDVILGQDFLQNVVTIMSKGSVLIVPSDKEWLGNLPCFVCHDEFVLGNIKNEEVKREVISCVENYKPTQTKDAPIKLRIVLKDDIPVTQRPRRLSLAEQRLVENQVTEWLNEGIIRVSFSEYSSPLVLVKKKDGNTRVCVDYRLINKKMVKDEFPLPIIDDLIDKLKDAKVFSVLDLKNGFFHLKVSEESIKYTSFVTHHGQYEFLRAPFGLSVCPKYFMRFVTIIFQELIAKGYLVIFIDDLLILARDEFQALERLKAVLEVASQYGLQINWKKAVLLSRRIEYLGHIIEDGKVQPSKEKTEAITRYPEPQNLKQLRSFVGLASYFRKYIKDFALIAKPLTDLLKKDVNFYFNDEHRQSFDILKTALSSSPVLHIYDPQLSTELHTDASLVAYSMILLQRDSNNELHPVHYSSRKTSDAEKKYSSYELEALAIIEGVKKFRHYLFGKSFKIVTDCQAFQKTLAKKDLTTRVARWVLLLEEYDFVIEHRPGSKMQHTDALSRNPYVGSIELHLHEQIRQAQMLDEGNKAIIEILKQNSYEDYSYTDGLLYKGLDRRLVIPKCLETEILRRVHERGHFGKRKMMEILEKDYYIKGLNRKIDEFLLSCIPCLLATKKEGKQEGFLNCIDKGSTPLHTLHCDHIGPLTETRKLYNYILTVVDAFTKFVWLFPVKGTTSKETIDKLKIHQQTFGNPTRIITDRGAAFTSNDFKDYCDVENIQHALITTGIPRGNGQVERIHRIIIPMLTKLCVTDNAQWYKHVSRVQRALNSTYQRSIDTTPFELMVGTKMRTKDDIEIYDLLAQEQRLCFVQDREELQIKAKEQILKIQDENRKMYNRNRKKSRKYAEGDFVAIRRTQFGTGLKLKPKYLGPYKVTKVKRNDRYDIEKWITGRKVHE